MPSLKEMDDFLTKYEDSAADSGLTRHGLNIPEEYKNQELYRLKNNERSYGRQFQSMYQYRLQELKTRVDKSASLKWDQEVINNKSVKRVEKVLDIQANEPCWVSGTIFCDMKKKLNILDDVEKGLDDSLPKDPKSYSVPETDVIMLEDESGRVILDGDLIRRAILVTGTIIAVLGMELQPGILRIVDIVYPQVSPQLPLKLKTQSSNNKVALVSGLNMVSASESLIKIDLLKQFLTGELGGSKDSNLACSVSRLIIAGDSINTSVIESNSNNAYGSVNTKNVSIDTIQLFDEFINELLPSIQVDVMPGKNDPAEICLPQQPLHKSFFPTSRKYIGSSSLKTITNPSWLELNGVRLLGTSGQNVSDIIKYLVPEDKLEAIQNDTELSTNIMEASILWQNIIPTAPDTLYCYPYDNTDPFTLLETPHVYFVGNQLNYNSKTISINSDEGKVSVRLISIPDFNRTGDVVLLDLDTLETEVVNIST